MGAGDGHLGVDAAGHLVFADGGNLAFDCGVNPCDPDPAVNVTLTWTDSDTTKSYMGETFTNGETKAICPILYVCQTFTSGTAYNFAHVWSRKYELKLRVYTRKPFGPQHIYYNTVDARYPGGAYSGGARLRARYAYKLFGPVTSTTTATTSLSTYGLKGSSLIFRGPTSIKNIMFSQMTTTSGVTLAWARGAGDWTCP